MEQLITQVRALYEKLTQQQRILLMAGTVLVLAGIVGFFFLNSRPDNVVLYSNLSRTDEEIIAGRLDALKIPYRLSKDSSAILVPRAQVDKLRVQLAQEGLPTSHGVGLEYLDKPSIYDTDPTLRAKYLRAQQTELVRTISQMQGVRWARVHLVIPKETVFVEKEKEPTAAVELQLEAGGQLNSSQIRAIVSLVAHSVEGLKPENVTVIDTEGNLLSDMIAKDESPDKLSLSQLEIQQKFERELQNKLQNMMDNTLGLSADGFHKAFVQVKAELDFDKKTIEQMTYIPTTQDGKGILRSQESNKEYLTGPKSVAGGVPGITSNVPGYPANSSGPVKYTKEQSTVNIEISSKKENISPSIGVDTKQLHVAVAVDSSIAPADVEKIKNLIQSEAGINPSRGDTIAVEPLKFDLTYRKKIQHEMESEASTERITATVSHLFIPVVLFILVVGILVAAYLKRGKLMEFSTSFTPPQAAPPTIPPEFFAPMSPPPASVSGAEEDVTAERKKMLEMLKQKGEGAAMLLEEVKEFLSANPQAAAELVRSWLAERE